MWLGNFRSIAKRTIENTLQNTFEVQNNSRINIYYNVMELSITLTEKQVKFWKFCTRRGLPHENNGYKVNTKRFTIILRIWKLLTFHST